MIAFSLSRIAFAGLAAALLVAMGASFLTGWLAALSQQQVADLRAMAAAKSVTAEKARDRVADPAAPVAPAAKPVAARAEIAAAQPPPPPPPAVAAAPAAAAAAPAPTAPAKPETTLSAAFSQPMLRMAIPPVPVTALPGQAAAAPSDDGDLRSMPQELNAEFGRLGDPLRPVYTVEAGLFTAEHVADALYQRLEAGRYDVYRVDGGTFGVAVRIGAFDDRRLAEAAAIELRAREGLDARVLRVAPAMMAELAKTRRDAR